MEKILIGTIIIILVLIVISSIKYLNYQKRKAVLLKELTELKKRKKDGNENKS